MTSIKAKEGFQFRRIHDGFIIGDVIHLGIDYSTGIPREDKPEYYEEINVEGLPYNRAEMKELNPQTETQWTAD